MHSMHKPDVHYKYKDFTTACSSRFYSSTPTVKAPSGQIHIRKYFFPTKQATVLYKIRYGVFGARWKSYGKTRNCDGKLTKELQTKTDYYIKVKSVPVLQYFGKAWHMAAVVQLPPEKSSTSAPPTSTRVFLHDIVEVHISFTHWRRNFQSEIHYVWIVFQYSKFQH